MSREMEMSGEETCATGSDLRVCHAELAGRVSVCERVLFDLGEKMDLSRKERAEQYADIKKSLDLLGEEISEYRGALRFGKWMAGTLIALGVPSAMLMAWGAANKH